MANDATSLGAVPQPQPRSSLSRTQVDALLALAAAIIGIVLVELVRQSVGLGTWWRKLGIVKKWGWLV